MLEEENTEYQHAIEELKSKVWYGECNMHIEKSEKRMLNGQVGVLAKEVTTLERNITDVTNAHNVIAHDLQDEISYQNAKIRDYEKEIKTVMKERDIITYEREELYITKTKYEELENQFEAKCREYDHVDGLLKMQGLEMKAKDENILDLERKLAATEVLRQLLEMDKRYWTCRQCKL